jgi:hypothetical protein
VTTAAHSRLPELMALRELFSHRAYWVVYPPGILATGLAFALLQAWLSVGIASLWVVRFLTLPQVILTVGFAFLFPLVILVDVYLWQHPACRIPGERGTGHGTTVAAGLLGVLPNALCCTPIIPSLLALVVSGGAIVSISVPVQYALSTYEPGLDAASLLALWLAVRFASRQLESGLRGQAVDASI